MQLPGHDGGAIAAQVGPYGNRHHFVVTQLDALPTGGFVVSRFSSLQVFEVGCSAR